MSSLEDILALITDPTMGPDAWGDVYSSEALELAQQMPADDQRAAIMTYLPTLPPDRQAWLADVFLEFPSPPMFNLWLSILPTATGDLAEIIIDRLRTWDLAPDQHARLVAAVQPFRGQGKLLDLVINSFAGKPTHC